MSSGKSDKEKINSLTDLPGVGPTTAIKLQEAGFSNLESVAAASTRELVSVAALGEKTAAKIIEVARNSLELTFMSAAEVLDHRKSLLRITTGSQNLDVLFGGSGIETGGITELFGEFRTGKTQIAHQLCVTAQLSQELGGVNIDKGDPTSVVYIDTEGTFRPERILSMSEKYGDKLDPQEVLKKIKVGRAFNSDHQQVLAEKISHEAQEGHIKLLVVDSLTSHFRAEYIGRGTLAARQQKLNQHIHTLLRMAEISNMAIIVTNQVHAKPDMFFGDPTAPVGGHIVAHASHTRIYLRKSKGNRRIARVYDSPLLPESEQVFVLTEQGIADP